MSKQRIRMNNDYDGHTIDNTFFHLHIPMDTKGVKRVVFKCHGWIHYEGQEDVEEEFTDEDIINVDIHSGFIDMVVMAPSGLSLPEYASLVVEFSYEQENYMEVYR